MPLHQNNHKRALQIKILTERVIYDTLGSKGLIHIHVRLTLSCIAVIIVYVWPELQF